MSTKASKLLSTIKENNLESNVSAVESEATDLDLALEVIEAYDLGFDCLKSSYNEDIDAVEQMLDAMEDDDINEGMFEGLLSGYMSEGPDHSVLEKPKPYHNIFSKTMGNKYAPIMAGRRKGGSADVSTLELGTDKFYDKDNKHYTRLWQDAMKSKQPHRQYRQLVRTLVNLVVNFKKRKPELSKKAKTFLKVVTNLSKPNSYYKTKK